MSKIGWGTRIAILYISFVLFAITMVVISLSQKIDLVSEDYYPKELVFQSQINSTNNANALSEQISHSITNRGIELQFPSLFKGEKVTGEIVFFRPSDASKDYKTPVQLNDQAQQLISLNNLSKGMYKMKIEWKAGDTSYFNEETIVIP